MFKVKHLLLLGASAASVASAATVEDVAARLEQALQRELDVLSSVQDAASASAAIQPLREAQKGLAALNNLVPENDLWNYIDSTEDIKPRLIRQIHLLAKQFNRLEQGKFYGCKELQAILSPQLKRAEEKPSPQPNAKK